MKMKPYEKIINHFLFLLFSEKKKKKGKVWPGHLPKQLTRLDTKGVQLSFVNGELLFKWINSLEQYKQIHYKA